MIDRKAVQDRLKKFDFSGLFTQELGWDWHTTNLTLMVDGQSLTLNAVAHKRGMVVYHCPSGIGALPTENRSSGSIINEEHSRTGRATAIPEYATRRKTRRLLATMRSRTRNSISF
jgi:hypothetical protein